MFNGVHHSCLFLRWASESLLNAAEADNCVREAKNAMVIKYLAMALSRTPLNLAALLFSKRGHTHNALGISAKFRIQVR